jgi:hypothetical protein
VAKAQKKVPARPRPKPAGKPKKGTHRPVAKKPVAKQTVAKPAKSVHPAPKKPVAKGKPAAEPAPEAAPAVPRGDGRRHVLSLSFLRDGDEFMARLETDAGEITELKNRSLDQLLTLVANELEDLLE